MLLQRTRAKLYLILVSFLIMGVTLAVKPAGSSDLMTVVTFDGFRELESYYEERNYTLRDIQKGEYIVLEELPDDFDTIRRVERRKRLFQRIVLPLIYLENHRVKAERNLLERIRGKLRENQDGNALTGLSRRHLNYLKERYDLEEKYPGRSVSRDLVDDLLTRINTIPPSLILAQATNESGWGTSRFAIRGNNLFGVRTYEESTPGFKPKGVPDTSSFRVRKFPTLMHSVRHYMLTLNTHWAYEEFRTLRTRHSPDRPFELVRGLSRYSERREEYLDRLVKLIKGNDYRRFDRHL